MKYTAYSLKQKKKVEVINPKIVEITNKIGRKVKMVKGTDDKGNKVSSILSVKS